MDHIVYVDARQGDLDKLLGGTGQMLVRGAAGRKLPYGRVQVGDRLFFINNDASGVVRAMAEVTEVFNSPQLTPEDSRQLIADNQELLQLTPVQIKRWGGKRFLVLIRLGKVCPVEPFAIDRSDYGNMDDWLPVGEIEKARVG